MEGEFKRGEFQLDEPVVIDWDLRTDFPPSPANSHPKKSDGCRSHVKFHRK